MGKGIETRLEPLAEGTQPRLRRLRVARRLRGFLCEPVESRTSEAIHRRTGEASSQGWFSGRVARVVAQTRDRMGREIRLGLNLAVEGFATTALRLNPFPNCDPR